jgi:hypothetical protein
MEPAVVTVEPGLFKGMTKFRFFDGHTNFPFCRRGFLLILFRTGFLSGVGKIRLVARAPSRGGKQEYRQNR